MSTTVEGRKKLSDSIEQLKMVTRRYARKQRKWIVNRFLARNDRKVRTLWHNWENGKKMTKIIFYTIFFKGSSNIWFGYLRYIKMDGERDQNSRTDNKLLHYQF